jgi:hypothetical protein
VKNDNPKTHKEQSFTQQPMMGEMQPGMMPMQQPGMMPMQQPGIMPMGGFGMSQQLEMQQYPSMR